jgi:hypothetical protein
LPSCAPPPAAPCSSGRTHQRLVFSAAGRLPP